MKDHYVRDLTEGMKVDSVFAIRSRDLRSARTGDAYLALELGDCTGLCPAVMFRPSPSDESIPAGSVVCVRGWVTTYRGVRRVSVESMRPAVDYDRRDLLPSGVREREELTAELRALVRRVASRPLRAVLRAVFGAPGFIDAFSTCPAGSTRHHAYVGGLLEHTVSVAGLALSLAAAYPQADRDLLVTAALLHDVGKVEELAYETAVDYTDAGKLVGHTVLGDRLVARTVAQLGDAVPVETALRLSHAILAHHGEPEWGAPRPPCSLEALLLHHADLIDARAGSYIAATSGAAVLQERWTDGGNAFGRPLIVPAPGATAVASRCA